MEVSFCARGMKLAVSLALIRPMTARDRFSWTLNRYPDMAFDHHKSDLPSGDTVIDPARALWPSRTTAGHARRGAVIA